MGCCGKPGKVRPTTKETIVPQKEAASRSEAAPRTKGVKSKSEVAAIQPEIALRPGKTEKKHPRRRLSVNAPGMNGETVSTGFDKAEEFSPPARTPTPRILTPRISAPRTTEPAAIQRADAFGPVARDEEYAVGKLMAEDCSTASEIDSQESEHHDDDDLHNEAAQEILLSSLGSSLEESPAVQDTGSLPTDASSDPVATVSETASETVSLTGSKISVDDSVEAAMDVAVTKVIDAQVDHSERSERSIELHHGEAELPTLSVTEETTAEHVYVVEGAHAPSLLNCCIFGVVDKFKKRPR
ncbi:hypothetical protein GNI_000740 [Gregarina niphandrodes]|uniref:Uncharacterized protein n=1 Tax=Gregarina niphandrodes TaxID=110365 RepID=A0A023BDU3_GRENI|nr:hypothetical protein GNI_000740 [Gregarina niphandrodes]EZG89708.1 hypothetical protein GNI_000740 [Gregarina niphandrodes]|eukprot:XP_011128448.1 hypothetical protein GNI_000740 [Gregarina niphandrodes]